MVCSCECVYVCMHIRGMLPVGECENEVVVIVGCVPKGNRRSPSPTPTPTPTPQHLSHNTSRISTIANYICISRCYAKCVYKALLAWTSIDICWLQIIFVIFSSWNLMIYWLHIIFSLWNIMLCSTSGCVLGYCVWEVSSSRVLFAKVMKR